MKKGTKLTKEIILELGFEENNWTDNGKPVYYGYMKDDVMIEITEDRFYYDGTDFKIKTKEQLIRLYHGLTGKKLTDPNKRKKEPTEIRADKIKGMIEDLPDPETVPLGHRYIFPHTLVWKGFLQMTFVTRQVMDAKPVQWFLQLD